MDQKSLDIGDECYRAALRHGLPCPFLCNCFVVPIYPDPELSSKDSASVVYCCSMGVCYFSSSHGVRRFLHICFSILARKCHCLRTN